MPILFGALVLGLMTAVVACGGGGDLGGAGMAGTPSPTSTAAAGAAAATASAMRMTPEPTATPGGDRPTATTALAQLPLDVTLTDGAIQPARLMARVGAITLTITNTGAALHRLELSVAGMILVSPDVPPGATVDWLVQIDAPGEYELYSAVDGVREAGMTAVLDVVG